MSADGTAPGGGILVDAGAVVAASIRRHPVLWSLPAAGLVSTPLWASPGFAWTSVAAAIAVLLRVPLLPRAALRGKVPLLLFLASAGAIAWADSARVSMLPWSVECGLSASSLLLLALATVHALRRSDPQEDSDAALGRLVGGLRRVRIAAAALAFCGALPGGLHPAVASVALDEAFFARYGHGGAQPLTGVSSVTCAWTTHLLVAVVLGTSPVGKSLRDCVAGLLIAYVTTFAAVAAAAAADPWEGIEGWQARQFPSFVVGLGGLALCFLFREVRNARGWFTARFFPALFLGFWLLVRVGADIPAMWWSTQSPTVQVQWVAAAVLSTLAHVALLVAAMAIPVRAGTLLILGAAQGAAASIWAGTKWDVAGMGVESAPVAAAAGALDAAWLLAAREVRRVLGIGVRPADALDDPYEDLPWEEWMLRAGEAPPAEAEPPPEPPRPA